MTDALASQLELDRNEHWLRSWLVEPALPDGSPDHLGWLVLTSRRAMFFRKSGLFGPGRLEKPARFSWRLEEIRFIVFRRYEMRVGYGDRLEIPGFAINDQGFRLNRETPSRGVVDELEQARRSRRSELRLRLP
ncbi:MAG: hypothetical protein ABSB97_04925 [Thermoplasmata archaeon]|jgi:hypothetical protein